MNVGRVAIIGAGTIGSAMIKCIKECIPNLEVIATGRSKETLERARMLGAEATNDNAYAVRKADLVIISVKPHHLPSVVEATQGLWKGKLVLSVMAGVKLSTLERLLHGAKVFRAMPNINVLIGMSSTAVTPIGREGWEVIDKILRCFGKVYWVPEEYLDAWTALIGSGPAFIAEIVDALVLGAIAVGMPRSLAYQAILDVLEGTARLLRKNLDKHPAVLRDMVTTPAGTTIRGIMELESRGVKSALMHTVEEAYRASVMIGEKISRNIEGKELQGSTT